MWWFDKDKRERKEVWDQEIQWPIGDIEAAHIIRDICRSAEDSAERTGGAAERRDNKTNNKNKNNDKNGRKDANEADRYERAAKAAMEIAIRISDELLRDSSVRQIVDLCMKAGDLRTARILVRAIQTPSIKAEVQNDHPTLRQ